LGQSACERCPVARDFLRPPHGTDPATIRSVGQFGQQNKKALVAGAGSNEGQRVRVAPHCYQSNRFGASCKRPPWLNL